MSKQVSVRLNKDVERFVKAYAQLNNISISTGIRELLHHFKLLVYITNGLEELYKMVQEYDAKIVDVCKHGNGVKINVSLNKSDIEFIDTVSRILKVKRSTALRFCILSLYYILKYLYTNNE